MKNQETIEKALAKYQELLEKNQQIKDFEETFLESNAFMDNKEAYIISAVKYYQADLAITACNKLIKNCKWILDIE